MKQFSYSVIALSGMIAASCSVKKEQQKPNIIVIYTDDLGYGDLSCYGNKNFTTPNLDSLANEGIRFTNFYSCSPVSTPSRAGLLTGRYPVRSGLTRVLFPNNVEGLDSSEITIARMLKAGGYATGIIGKWHLGHLPANRPVKHGFDYWFGLPYSNDMQWEKRKDPPLPLFRNNVIIDQPVYQATLTQRYTAEAINFIAQHRDEPFFLYLAHTFPHLPLHVSKEFEKSSPTLYGDVVKELDKSVGDVIKALQHYGIEENTLVVFSSDNGPQYNRNADSIHGMGSPGELRGWKATNFEGGIKVPTLARWKGKIKPGQVIEDPAIMLDWLPTFAAITGASVPQDRIIDGKDISGLLFGTGKRSDSVFYFYFNEELQAIRSGNWKYKAKFEGYKTFEAHEDLLFNLKEDPNEKNNLALTDSIRLKALKEQVNTFLSNLKDIPAPKIMKVETEENE